MVKFPFKSKIETLKKETVNTLNGSDAMKITATAKNIDWNEASTCKFVPCLWFLVASFPVPLPFFCVFPFVVPRLLGWPQDVLFPPPLPSLCYPRHHHHHHHRLRLLVLWKEIYRLHYISLTRSHFQFSSLASCFFNRFWLHFLSICPQRFDSFSLNVFSLAHQSVIFALVP